MYGSQVGAFSLGCVEIVTVKYNLCAQVGHIIDFDSWGTLGHNDCAGDFEMHAREGDALCVIT